MARQNDSTVIEFVLEGLTKKPELQLPLFLVFLGIYLVTVVGNLGMILLITFNSKLQSPMYFFLGNLSFLDLFYSSVVTPKLLENFIWEKNIISYNGCMTQLFFFCVFAIAECYMLTAMAYDRYVAICSPLLYNVIMSQKVCNMLMSGVYIMATSGAMVHTIFMTRLSFCEDVIHHYFCDILPLLKLSCSTTYINELLVIIGGGFNMLVTTVAIIISYAFILSTILRIPSSESRSKAFSTCGSHLTVVAVLYGSMIFMYLKPASSSNMAQEKVASVFYTTVIPMLNPLIYSLRNKDVKNVLIKVMSLRY
ncbi:PREDICTED: olfactory receptor 151-like [Chrysochloris asiatica]|uniref:Olfactory receptor n=1 Tax=Chrysochloris asiatica TaxID=185453 RepID=A0A9B0WXQ0_CHRAS|nr:PREDICTED: olfactory receptor 151-like [Chrysochloris asiatica]